MIRLTIAKASGPSFFWVNVNRINWFRYKAGENVVVISVYDMTFEVEESPEEILKLIWESQFYFIKDEEERAAAQRDIG